MSLQHELRDTSVRIPELDTTVLGTTQYPVAVRSEGNAENKVLVTFKCADALAAWVVSAGNEAALSRQLPHLDGLVETTTDQTVARRSKSHTIHTVLVAMLAFQSDDKLASLNVPHTDALVERSRCDVEVVWRNGHGGDAILNGEVGDLHVGFEIPETDTPVATTGSNNLSIPGKVERVNILFVAGELVLDCAAGNVPDLVSVSSGCLHVSRQKHTLMTLSSAPVARYCPLGLKQTLRM